MAILLVAGCAIPSDRGAEMLANQTTRVEPPRAVARFACDDKYSNQDDPCDVDRWMRGVSADPWSVDLLAHHDGCPDGAIWNGDAPIYLIVSGPAEHTASIGDRSLDGVIALDLGWFRIPEETWSAALHPSPDPAVAYEVATVRIDGAPAGEIWYASGE